MVVEVGRYPPSISLIIVATEFNMHSPIEGYVTDLNPSLKRVTRFHDVGVGATHGASRGNLGNSAGREIEVAPRIICPAAQ